MRRGAKARDIWFFIHGVLWDTMWCFAVAVREAFVAVIRLSETRHVVVLASIVRVVCFCSLRLSVCRAWPTLNMKHKFAHIFVERACDVMNARHRRSVAAVFFVCRMCRMLRVRCVLCNVRISMVTKLCFSKGKTLLLMCGFVNQTCFCVRVVGAASEELCSIPCFVGVGCSPFAVGFHVSACHRSFCGWHVPVVSIV